MQKLLCFNFEYVDPKHPMGQFYTGVCAYTLTEARRYFQEKLEHEGLQHLVELIPQLEPKIYDDTAGMSVGWR